MTVSMRQPIIRPAEAPARINWPELIDLAERVGIKVWRYDKKIGRVVVVESDVVDRHDHDDVEVDSFSAARASPPADSDHLHTRPEMNPKKEQQP